MTDTPKRAVHLHLISDSTGETVSSMARSALAQFDAVEVREHAWSLVRTDGQLEKVIKVIREYPGFVMHTIAKNEHRKLLRDVCADLNIPCVPLLSRVVSEFAAFLGVEARNVAGRKHALDKEYFSRVEAINFSIAHDDGQITHDLDEADIILVGVSRTSKSPTSMYLAHWGFRTANVPYVQGVPLPEELFDCKRPFIAGLTIRPETLSEIRRNRLLSLAETDETTYTDIEAVEHEVIEARKLCRRKGWPVIDVTRRSVEETAAAVLQYYRGQHGGTQKIGG